MRFRNPKGPDHGAHVWGLKLFIAAMPVFALIAIWQGDAPVWLYVAMAVTEVALILFVFVLVPAIEDWAARKQAGRASER